MRRFRERLAGALSLTRRLAKTEYDAFKWYAKWYVRRLWRVYIALFAVAAAVTLALQAWKEVIGTYLFWLIMVALSWAVLNAVMHVPVRSVSIRPDQLRGWMVRAAVAGIPGAVLAGVVASY